MFQLNIASVGGKGGKIKKTKNPLQIEIFTSFNCILLASVDPKNKKNKKIKTPLQIEFFCAFWVFGFEC